MTTFEGFSDFKRIQFIELEDLNSTPQILKDYMRDFLYRGHETSPFGKAWASKIDATLPKGKRIEILDLCSGSGGPLPIVTSYLKEVRGEEVEAHMTDLHPNQQAGAFVEKTFPEIKFHKEPLDARKVPGNFKGKLRTMFCSFHHIPPTEAQAILKSAFEDRSPICVFETTKNTAAMKLIMILTIIPMVLIQTLFIKPFRLSRILLTYVFPILPLMIFWDGLVSSMRTYSVEEMKFLTKDLQAEDYAWEIGEMEVPGIPFKFPYLIGKPI